ncbi:MAG: enoyl-CoA hydratase [Actinobacteria bacterium]|uniref:Unannotated protein n=1 Tax=freshwater metagenome TaxID=449393 RepID=A0A6J7KCX2_9ZZZZ|nr:enoyl-CoA hydratase [Actinomycetota bacterium]MSW78898.1 enoyl-CoA hydratase [Actinomycetota bacterium]MSX54054.1 enoyl-CoA hydratase [Actinomycetota bacterium]MSZ84467.1 enoyl-CoA hydratase [Actinomycetota bacterium]MTB19419.1 enoyl-CoA hydratase [Actinomycetota bacterium]
MILSELSGQSLGHRTVSYDDRTTILYALCAGATADELDLVWETRLRPLPSLATSLGLWAVEAAGNLGAYDRTRSLHVGQRLAMLSPLPPTADIAMTAQIDAVWDKGRAAIVELGVRSSYFELGYTIFLPGMGGFGGESGPQVSDVAPFEPTGSVLVRTTENLALLYRLTGDRHPVHVDPVTAASNGFERPILHGLCTLAVGVYAVAGAIGAHPADLTSLAARFAAPVFPGQVLEVRTSNSEGQAVRFDVTSGGVAVLKDGTASFTGTSD